MRTSEQWWEVQADVQRACVAHALREGNPFLVRAHERELERLRGILDQVRAGSFTPECEACGAAAPETGDILCLGCRARLVGEINRRAGGPAFSWTAGGIYNPLGSATMPTATERLWC